MSVYKTEIKVIRAIFWQFRGFLGGKNGKDQFFEVSFASTERQLKN